MPKKKSSKLPKGARQNRRKKMQAAKLTAAPAPEKDATKDAVEIAEPTEAAAPAADLVQEAPAAEKAAKPVEAPKAEKKPAAKKTAAEKKPAAAKESAEKKAAADAPVERKKPGRKPMTEEQKAEARKQREALKAAAANAKTTVYIQYKGMEDGVDDLVEAARADYRAAHKRKPIDSIKIYVKPEEYAAYYVVNDSYFGKVNM